MGFFGSLTSGVIKLALTPVAAVKDAISVATGEDADATGDLIDEAMEDLDDAVDEVTGG